MRHLVHVLVVYACVVLGAIAQSPDLGALKTTYESALSAYEKDFTNQVAVVEAAYRKDLQTLRSQVQASGDLDSLKAVLAEIRRAERVGSLPDNDFALTALNDLANSHFNHFERLCLLHAKRIYGLAEGYDSRLSDLQIGLTREGMVHEATTAQIERKMLAASEPVAWARRVLEPETGDQAPAPVIPDSAINGAEKIGSSWSLAGDFSKESNPSGAWSYGWKTKPTGVNFERMTKMYYGRMWTRESNAPAVKQLKDGVFLWAKDNTDGYPAIRWTCPGSGHYDITGSFTGTDKNGVDVMAYVVVDGNATAQRNIGSGEEWVFSVTNVTLRSGSKVDFAISWGGKGSPNGSWTKSEGVIRQVVR